MMLAQRNDTLGTRTTSSGMNMRCQAMINLDDIKVAAASVTGIGNWMLQIDVILKVAISVATLFYIVLKIREQLNKK